MFVSLLSPQHPEKSNQPADKVKQHDTHFVLLTDTPRVTPELRMTHDTTVYDRIYLNPVLNSDCTVRV